MKGRPRLLFWGCFAWSLLLIWLAPRPMLLDLPQHAAQVSLLQDLLAGHSAWSREVEIRWGPTYLAAYPWMLLFASFCSIVTASKLTLSLGLATYTGLGILLRRRWHGAPELDWLMFIGYFSFDYDLGFITLLLAAPWAMLWITLADRQREQPSVRNTAATSLAAILTLIGHPVMWLYASATAALTLALEFRRWRAGSTAHKVQCLMPLAISSALAGAVFLHLDQSSGASDLILPWIDGHYDWARLSGLLFLPLGDVPSLLAAMAIIALLLAGILIGQGRAGLGAARSAPLWIALAWFALAPSLLLTAAALHARILMLLFPAWAWAFCQGKPDPAHGSGRGSARATRPWSGERIGLLLAVGAVTVALALRTAQTLPLMAEAASFEPILAHMAANKRVLYLQVPYPAEAPTSFTPAFRHFGLWYQAEKHGLVDFNFGWGNQMIVRFKRDQIQRLPSDVNRDIRLFNWQANDADRYDYFLIHLGMAIDLAHVFSSAPCPPRVEASNGRWVLLVPGDCSARKP